MEMDLTGEIEGAFFDLQPFCRNWLQGKTLWLNRNHRFLGSHPNPTVIRVPRGDQRPWRQPLVSSFPKKLHYK